MKVSNIVFIFYSGKFCLLGLLWKKGKNLFIGKKKKVTTLNCRDTLPFTPLINTSVSNYTFFWGENTSRPGLKSEKTTHAVTSTHFDKFCDFRQPTVVNVSVQQQAVQHVQQQPPMMQPGMGHPAGYPPPPQGYPQPGPGGYPQPPPGGYPQPPPGGHPQPTQGGYGQPPPAYSGPTPAADLKGQ